MVRRALPVIGPGGVAVVSDAAEAPVGTRTADLHRSASHAGQHRGGDAGTTGDREAGAFAALQAQVADGLERLDAEADDAIRRTVYQVLDGVDALHREGLERLLTVVHDTGAADLLSRLAMDPVVAALLDLYDLLPGDRRAEVDHALRDAYGYLGSHGGHLEVLAVEGDQVHIRLAGSCSDCPGSSATLRRVVEEALREELPWFGELVVELPEEPAEPVAAARSTSGPHAPVPRALRRPRWVSVGRVGDLLPGRISAVRPEGVAVVLLAHEGEVVAYADGCPPGSPLTFQLGRVEGNELVCAWHACRYDVRNGRRTDADGRLTVYPVAVRDGEVLIALGTEEVAAT